MLGAIGVFLAAQYFGARILLKLRGSPFLRKRYRANAGALTQKRGFACARNYLIIFCAFENDVFQKAPPICGKAQAEKVNLRALYNKRALNNGVPENRNARSGVRFLGKRSNKCTRTWRQAKRAACRPLPCCDERKERKQAVSGKAARPRVFSEIKQKLSSLLRDFARRKVFLWKNESS